MKNYSSIKLIIMIQVYTQQFENTFKLFFPIWNSYK